MQTDLGKKYLNDNIRTASPEALVTMLYEGAIKSLGQAKNDLVQRNWEKAHHNIIRTQNIVSELALSLDKEQGQDIADGLNAIYRYVNERLVQADIRKDTQGLDECLDLLEKMNATWQEVTLRARSVDRAGVNIVS